MRVRFAPSPTGLLHVGNARTAVINYAFSLKNKAHFILRLDDTDRARSKDIYAQTIQSDLEWLGIEWSDFFKQSDRFSRYQEVVQKWIQEGLLYPCYETAEELEFKRRRQLAQGKPPIYDRSSFYLTKAQKETYEKEGKRPHWRFRLSDETMIWQDLVRGHCEVDPHHVSDPVLIKEDGTYLYTLSSVIDDVDYKITHILRGEDHVTNTGVQLQLFKALNYTPDHFAHTSLLMDADGKPLSKRLGSLGLQTLSKEGLEPMTLVSFLLRLGTSLPIEPFVSWHDAVADFDFETFGRAAAKFDEKELWSLNHKVIAHLPYQGPHPDIWNLVSHNLEKRDDFQKWVDILKGDSVFSVSVDKNIIQAGLKALPHEPWDIETWKIWTKQISEKTGLKGKELFMNLRKALTGQEHGPEMKMIILMLGKEKTEQRLKNQS
jgi:glutamyl-tRNA synthetase